MNGIEGASGSIEREQRLPLRRHTIHRRLQFPTNGVEFRALDRILLERVVLDVDQLAAAVQLPAFIADEPEGNSPEISFVR